MSHFGSAISDSVPCSFSSVDQLTKGKIYFGNKFNHNINVENLILKNLYYCKGENHDDTLKLKHSYLILEDKNSKYYRLELLCNSSDNLKEIELTNQNSNFEYIYSKTAHENVSFSQIIQYIQYEFQNTAFNPLINDCDKLNYDIIYKFFKGYPQHQVECGEKVIAIYFGISQIVASQNLQNHGFIVAETDSYYWKFEIGGAQNNFKLNMKKIQTFNYQFKTTDIKEGCTLLKIIMRSESEWGNQTYQTVFNNCFDYCKFVMLQFTNDQENIDKINTFLKKTMVYDVLRGTRTGASALLGYEIGLVGGPIGMGVGAVAGGLFGLFSSFFFRS
ncbi:hypothetical protein ABPG72_021685 [Tetrahymena utriculariae]